MDHDGIVSAKEAVDYILSLEAELEIQDDNYTRFQKWLVEEKAKEAAKAE